MGVRFSRMKVHSSRDPMIPSTVAVWEDADHPPLVPIHGISRFVDEGRASKVNVPYIASTPESGGTTIVDYKSVWVPLGQEGWSIKIQAKLRYNDETGVDEIANWLTVDSAQILCVATNQCDREGRHDPNLPA